MAIYSRSENTIIFCGNDMVHLAIYFRSEIIILFLREQYAIFGYYSHSKTFFWRESYDTFGYLSSLWNYHFIFSRIICYFCLSIPAPKIQLYFGAGIIYYSFLFIPAPKYNCFFCGNNMLLLAIYSRSENIIIFCGNNMPLLSIYSRKNIIVFITGIIYYFWLFTLALKILLVFLREQCGTFSYLFSQKYNITELYRYNFI